MAEITEKSFPWDSELVSGEEDRLYLAEDFTRYFSAFISSGTFMREPTNLQIIANDDMSVTLKPGAMMIDGVRYDNTADKIINLEPADGVLDRVDRISITWIKTERAAYCTLQKGTMSYEPIVPQCRRNAEYKDYVVADIYVKAGAISISQVDITDQRLNSEVCGLAVPFAEVDTSALMAQLQAYYEQVMTETEQWQDEKKNEFEEWFESMKDILSGDVAANLQKQIGTLSNLETENKTDLVSAINELANRKVDVLDTKEAIEANTDDGKVAGAKAVKEMVRDVTDSLVKNISLPNSNLSVAMTTAIENNVAKGQGAFNFFLSCADGGYCVQGYATASHASGIITQQAAINSMQFIHALGGADTVLKKLGSLGADLTLQTTNNLSIPATIGKTYMLSIANSMYNSTPQVTITGANILNSASLRPPIDSTVGSAIFIICKATANTITYTGGNSDSQFHAMVYAELD